MDMMLAVETLAFGYRNKPVGRDVSFTVAAGETIGLLGPNGCGKTTLFRTILGLLKPQAGRVVLEKSDVAHMPRHEIARRMGYVPQAHIGYFPFTVRDIVLMGRTAHLGMFAAPTARDHAIAERALDMLGIAHLADNVYTQISGGERQLALVARALTQEPRVLVMDEPTANLDFGNQLRVLEQIGALAHQGIAVILSTHDPDQAFRCCDRVVLLHQGRMLDCAPPERAITPATLKQLYGVDVRIIEVEIEPGRRIRVCSPALSPHAGARRQ
jgi:iron complex transport system ATP-binding protein